MEDEHLDAILATELDEVIKSSIENLVQIPSESKGIPDKMCDVPFRDYSPPLDISKDQFELRGGEGFSHGRWKHEDDILHEKLSKTNLLIAKIEAIILFHLHLPDFGTSLPSNFLNFVLGGRLTL
ncbi:hypothetical protein Tco_0684531 [Tanacetum coccineum]